MGVRIFSMTTHIAFLLKVNVQWGVALILRLVDIVIFWLLALIEYEKNGKDAVLAANYQKTLYN